MWEEVTGPRRSCGVCFGKFILHRARGPSSFCRGKRRNVSLIVRLWPDRVRIYDDSDTPIAVHVRSFDSGFVVENPAHIAALRGYKQHARELRGRDELTRQCPSANRLLGALAERNSPLQSEVRHLLLLCSRYGANSVVLAIAACLDQGLASARSVERRLDEDRHRQGLAPSSAMTSSEPVLSSPTDLATYDRIGKKKAKETDK